MNKLSAVEQHQQQQHAASASQLLPAAVAQHKHEPLAPELAVSTGVSSGSSQQPAWLTWTDVGESLYALGFSALFYSVGRYCIEVGERRHHRECGQGFSGAEAATRRRAL